VSAFRQNNPAWRKGTAMPRNISSRKAKKTRERLAADREVALRRLAHELRMVQRRRLAGRGPTSAAAA
jgi:hypothetical protein